MRRYGLPVLPAIIGVILGPAAEQQLRRALQISDGSCHGPGQHAVLGDRVRGHRGCCWLWPLIRRFLPNPSAERDDVTTS